MKKGLLYFILSCIVLLSIVFVCDICTGKILDNLLPKIGCKNDIGRTYFSLYEVETPIVIVGSSRASHHYVTSMIEDSLYKPAYNIGRDGCFFNYNLCVINSILDRYSPELIIWENSNDAFNYEARDPIETLYPYYKKNKFITQLIKKQEKTNIRLCLTSNLYRYNSNIHKIIIRYILKDTTFDNNKGYLPLTPKHNNQLILHKNEDTLISNTNYSKLKMLEALLIKAKEKNVKIVMVDSPKYIISQKTHASQIVKNLIDSCNMVYIDNTNLDEFLQNPEYFNDRTHLNQLGANYYTRFFINQLKSLKI